MKIRNCVKIHNRANYYQLDVSCSNEQYCFAGQIIFDLLQPMFANAKIFVDYYGSDELLLHGDMVIEKQTDMDNAFRHKLWVTSAWLTCFEKVFADDFYTIVYFYENAYRWESFCKSKNSIHAKMTTEPSLLAVVTFGECQFPSIYVHRETSILRRCISFYKNNGYSISMLQQLR